MTPLTIALEKVDFLPPERVTDDTSILTLKHLVYEPLLHWVDGAVAPGLFGRWQHTPDGRRWQFFIRPGAGFHDGVACTAEHVITYITTLLGAVDTFGMKWSYARYFAAARLTPGPDNSVVVENPDPIADVLDIFSEFFPCRPTPDGGPPVGTGPFRIIDFTAGQNATLARVSPGGVPATVTVRAVPTAGERYRLVRSGAVDAALNLQHMDRRPDFHGGLVWGQAVNTLSVMYYLNCLTGPFAVPEARLAVNHAIDAQAIIDEVFHGLGVPSSTVVSPYHLGARSAGVRPIAHDFARAKTLIDQAGGPAAITLRTPTYMPDRAVAVSDMVAAALRGIGFDVTIDVADDRPEYARQVGRRQIGDLAIFDSSPHSTYRVLNDKISSAVQAVWWQGFDDPEVETMILAANHAVGDGARETTYGRCLRRLNANPPWLFLFHPVHLFAAQPAITGLSLDHKGVLRLP